MFRPALLASTAIALALTFSPTSARAEDQKGFYVFGDSLSDPGNLYRLTGHLLPASPPYYQGRYSNGPVWTEDLPDVAGLNGDLANNYAVAGAKSGSQSLNDVANQIGAYLAKGAGKADPNGLYVVFSGANDYSNGLSTASSVPAFIGEVVGLISQDVQALAAAGAKEFIVPNLPNLGDTPLGKSSGASATLNSVSAGHNAALQAEMARLQSTLGVKITLVDTNALLKDITANPALYGITNTDNPCLGATGAPTGACPTDAAANSSIFWDAQHPTQTVHAAFAQLANGTLQTSTNGVRSIAVAGYLSQALIAHALDQNQAPGAAAKVQTADANTSASDSGTQMMPDGKTSVSLKIGGVFGTEDGDSSLAGMDYSGWQLGVGADYRLNDTVSIGAGIGYGHANADLDNNLGDVTASGVMIDLHAGARQDHVFGLISGGVSIDSYDDIDRATGNALRPTANGDTDGHSLFLSAKAGVDMPLDNNWTLTPTAGLRWIHSRIDGYTETNAGALNLTVDDQNLNSVRGQLALRLSGEMADAGKGSFRPHLEMGLDHEFSGDTGDINARFASGSTLSGNGSSGDDTRLLLGVGFDWQLDQNMTAALNYDGRYGADSRQHAVMARLNWAL